MTKKATAMFLYPLFTLCVCLLIWFGYRLHNSRKPTKSPVAATLASNQNAVAPGKAVRRLLPQWPIPTPHKNLQQELRKSKAAVRHNPRDPDAHSDFGQALEEAGSLDAAIEQYRLALKLPPRIYGRAFLYRDLGMALEKKGDIDGALAALRKSIVSWPVKHDLSCFNFEREVLGNLLEEKGDYQAELQYWKDLMSVAKFPDKCREHYDRVRTF